MENFDDITRQIRQQADIVDIIGEYVELRRRGSNFIGLCPFHQEKTPSFNVSPTRQIYKCFGCGKSGDVIKFLMEFHNIPFPEARENLAKRLGIVIPKGKESEKQKKQRTQVEAVYNCLNAAAGFYVKVLNSTEGKPGLQYFRSRKFSKETIAKFQLGYAPDSWDAVSKELTKQGFSDSTLIDAGLIIKKDGGSGYYDRFRGRTMFPIRDYLGRIAGFGARRMNEDNNQPKYINSPQTQVYDKSRILYGLFEGKNDLRNKKQALLVEGYADVLTLHQAGIENAVASSGTSLTKEQLDEIARFGKQLFIVYDADKAGIKAAERGLEIAIAKGFDVSIVRLPAGDDPDSLVRDHGRDAFDLYQREAVSFMEFKVELMKSQGLLSSPSGKAEAAREIARLIASIPDKLQHDFYIQKMSSLLDLSESQLTKIYDEKSKYEKKELPDLDRRPVREYRESAPAVNTEKDKDHENKDEQKEKIPAKKPADILKSLLPEEYLLLHLALSHENVLDKILWEHGVKPENFLSTEGRRLFEILIDINKQDENLLTEITLAQEISEEDKEALTTIGFEKETPSENWKKYGEGVPEIDIERNISDAALRLESIALEKRKPEILAQMKHEDTTEEVKLSLMQEFNRLSIKQQEIMNKLSGQ